MTILGVIFLMAAVAFVWLVAYPMGKSDGYHQGRMDAEREAAAELRAEFADLMTHRERIGR